MNNIQQPDITFTPLLKITDPTNNEDISLATCDQCGAIIAWTPTNTTNIIKHGQHHTQGTTQ